MLTATTTQDSIFYDFVVKAPKEKVWRALTTREGWSGWFSEDVDSDFQAGSLMTLDFGGYGTCFAKVVEREEGRVFGYAWHPGEDCAIDKYPESEMTKVRFEIEEVSGGTRIRLEESGFAHLPEERRINALKLNAEGWESELGEMIPWVEEDKVQPHTGSKIVRERVYPASAEKVWRCVATAEGITSWFCKRIRGDFSVGGMVVLTFDFGSEFEGPCKITACDTGKSYTFRWHPGQDEGCTWDQFPEEESTSTTVTVTAVEGGAHLKISEVGFENIPESRRMTVLGMNREGWSQVMGMIGEALAK